MKKCMKICICCPRGCHLAISSDGKNISVEGNHCKRGVEYACQELTDPRRVVTASVIADAPERFCIPVKSNAPVPKAMIAPLLKELSRMQIALPKCSGDVIIKNYADLNIDIICTGDFK